MLIGNSLFVSVATWGYCYTKYIITLYMASNPLVARAIAIPTSCAISNNSGVTPRCCILAYFYFSNWYLRSKLAPVEAPNKSPKEPSRRPPYVTPIATDWVLLSSLLLLFRQVEMNGLQWETLRRRRWWWMWVVCAWMKQMCWMKLQGWLPIFKEPYCYLARVQEQMCAVFWANISCEGRILSKRGWRDKSHSCYYSTKSS